MTNATGNYNTMNGIGFGPFSSAVYDNYSSSTQEASKKAISNSIVVGGFSGILLTLLRILQTTGAVNYGHILVTMTYLLGLLSVTLISYEMRDSDNYRKWRGSAEFVKSWALPLVLIIFIPAGLHTFLKVAVLLCACQAVIMCLNKELTAKADSLRYNAVSRVMHTEIDTYLIGASLMCAVSVALTMDIVFRL